MARTLNEQLLSEAGLDEPQEAHRGPGLLTRALRVLFLARLGVLLIALVLALTFMVLPWPNTPHAAIGDLVVLAAAAFFGTRAYRRRRARQTLSEHNVNQGDRWTSTS
jgi:membrane protein YdbS with pleckstrin-like domain